MKHEMYDNNQRTEKFKRSTNLESTLELMNNILSELPNDQLRKPELPIIMIMGCPRSGSTLLLQYLANTGLFSYPSNLVARFFKNPFMGLLVQQNLIDNDSSNQMGFDLNLNDYKSTLGKTFGAKTPSEFWYFWRSYFQFGEHNQLSEEELSTIDIASFFKKLSSFEILTGNPLVLKGLMLNWNIPYLFKHNRKIIFVNLKRDVIDNAKSLYKARLDYFNDANKWYSFKPPEYSSLLKMTPIEQVVSQVLCNQKAVNEGLKTIPENNKVNVSYEDFCLNPTGFLEELILKINLNGGNIKDTLELSFSESFKVSSSTRHELQKEFVKAVDKLC